MALGGTGGGGGGSAGAVRAGRAFVEVSANDDLLTRGLQAAERKLHAWGKTVRNIGLGVSGVGGVVLAPITAAFGEMLAHFSDVQKAAGRLFTTPEIASGLGYALGGLEEMEHAARHLQRAIAENKPAFAELGLSAAKLKGLNLEEQFLAVGDALDKVDDPTKKVAVAFELLGRQGASLASRLTGAGLREKIGRAGLIGDVVSSEDAANALKVSKLFSDIGKAIKNTWREVGASILGVTDTFALYAEKLILGIKVVRDWIHDHRALVLTVAIAAAGVVALGTAIAGLGVFVGLAGTALGGLATVTSLVAAALGAVVSPAGLAVAAVAGLGYLFVTQTEQGRALGRTVADYFGEVISTAREAGPAIAHAFQAGRLDLAWKVALAGLQLEWQRFLSELKGGWDEFRDFFLDAWDLIKLGAQEVWDDLILWMVDRVNDVVNAIKGLPEQARQAVEDIKQVAAEAGTKALDVPGNIRQGLGIAGQVGGALADLITLPDRLFGTPAEVFGQAGEAAQAGGEALKEAAGTVEKAGNALGQTAADEGARADRAGEVLDRVGTRMAERAEAKAARQAELDAAREEFRKAVAEAAAAVIPEKAPKRPPGTPGAGFEIGTSAGAFSASDFRQLLGGNKVEQQQLAVLEEIRDAVKAGTGGFF